MAKENILKKYPWILHLLIMLGVSLVVLMLVLFFIRIYARQGEEYELPDMVGLNITELQENNPMELDVVHLPSG